MFCPFPLRNRSTATGTWQAIFAISVETAAKQAEEYNHPLPTELQILLLHGLLHLGGYRSPNDTGRMAREEAALRRRFGLTQGLIERSTKPAREKARRSRKP